MGTKLITKNDAQCCSEDIANTKNLEIMRHTRHLLSLHKLVRGLVFREEMPSFPPPLLLEHMKKLKCAQVQSEYNKNMGGKLGKRVTAPS